MPALEETVQQTLKHKKPVDNFEFVNPVNDHTIRINTTILQSEQIGVIWINLIIQDLFPTVNAGRKVESDSDRNQP